MTGRSVGVECSTGIFVVVLFCDDDAYDFFPATTVKRELGCQRTGDELRVADEDVRR